MLKLMQTAIYSVSQYLPWSSQRDIASPQRYAWEDVHGYWRNCANY